MEKILFVQNGDYAEAYDRFERGEPETYRDQKYSVELVKDLADEHDVTVVAMCDRPHDTRLRPGLRSIGVPYEKMTADWLSALFDDCTPDRLFCRTPHHLVLQQAKRRAIPTLAQFADIFVTSGPKQLYRNLRLRQALSGAHLACVSNHSRNASLSMKKALFLPETRIVPWDREVILTEFDPKPRIVDPNAPRLFYAGLLLESKGVSDLLDAMEVVRGRGLRPHLTIVGRGDPAPWVKRAEAKGLADAVDFPGILPNAEVLDLMRAHDVVIVPTRRAYNEGLPNTLREALAVRTPLIMSDHPAFSGRLKPERDCLVFRAGDADDLAAAIVRLAQSAALYGRLSQNARAALEQLPFGMFWPQLWAAFIANPRPDSDWVANNSLAVLLKKLAAA